MAEGSRSFCMLTTFYPPYHFGGDAMYVYHLANALARRGHEVTVVHCVDAFRVLTSAAPRGDFPHEPGVTVVPLRNRLGPVSPLVTYLTGTPGLKAPSLRDVFRRSRFDVVHYHLITLVGGPGLLSYGNGVKLYTTHDHWLVCPMYDLWRENRELCERPSCLRCQLSFRRPPQLWRHTAWQRHLEHVDLFLSPSRSTIEQHRRRGFPHPMRHLPYFLPDQSPADPPTGEGRRPYFLFVGRLVRLKGAHTLIEAFRRYEAADLVVAGDGPYASELRRQAAGLEHVRFTGRLHPDDLRSQYAGAIAVLVPSLVYETFGLIALEALAHGTPVIARDLGAPPEVVAESGAGFTYRTEDELVQAMERLRSDPVLRDDLGRRGREAWRERWSEEAHVRRYLEAVDEASELRQ